MTPDPATKAHPKTFDSDPSSGPSPTNPAMPATWNSYAYVVADPVNLIDPTGENCDDTKRQGLIDSMNRYLFGSKDNKGIIQRYWEQVNGKIQPGTEGWDTHNDQITQRQDSLRDVLNQWNTDDCGNGGPPPVKNVWYWATRGGVDASEYKGPAAPYGPGLVGYIRASTLLTFSMGVSIAEQLQDASRDAAWDWWTSAAALAPIVTSTIRYSILAQ